MPTSKQPIKPSPLEFSAFSGHGPSLPKEEIQSMPYEAQQRLFQFLLMNPTPLSSKQLLYANKMIFRFTDKNLAELCVAKTRFDVLVDILNRASEAKNDIDKTELISSIYNCACEHGFLEIIMHIEKMEGFNKKTAASANDYAAYQKACKNGHFNIICRLEAILGFDKKTASSALDYAAYLAACENGHLQIIDHLEAILGFDKKAASSALNYAAYRTACGNGHLHIIKHLEEIDGFDKKAASSALNYAAYRTACENGHPHIINHLEEMNGFNKKVASSVDNYAAYRTACENGHLHIIEHLENIDGFDKQAASSVDNYAVYCTACENGQLNIIKHLESIPGFDKQTAARADFYKAFRKACENGHLHIVEHLEKIDGFSKKTAVRDYNFAAYRGACIAGHLNVVVHLEQIKGFDRLTAANFNQYHAYRGACENGHINIINHLQKINLSDADTATRTISYGYYRKACAKGQIDRIHQLEKIEGFNKSAAASSDQYEAYRKACENGHLDIIRHLGEIPDFHDNAAASIDDYLPYRMACGNGHLNVIEHLATISGFSETMAAQAQDFDAYLRACENGHLHVIKHLEKIKYFLTRTNHDQAYRRACENGRLNVMKHLEKISNHFYVYNTYRIACRNGHLNIIEYLEKKPDFEKEKAIRAMLEHNDYDLRITCQNQNIINHLLMDPNFFQVIEERIQKLDAQYIDNFVNMSLRLLQTEKERFQTINPNAVFDVTPDEAKRYIYMLKNLIRRGGTRGYKQAENLNDKMILLLSIPSVKALCHQRLSDTGEENALLKFAMYSDNVSAIQILLSIPKVFQLTIKNNFSENARIIGNFLSYFAYTGNLSELTDDESQRLNNHFKHFRRELGLIAQTHNWDRKDNWDHEKESTLLRWWAFRHENYGPLPQELIEQELRMFYQDELHSLLKQTQFTTDLIELILANYYRITAGLGCDYEQFHKLDITEDKKSAFKETLKQKYGKKVEEYMALLDQKLTTSNSGDFLTFAKAYDLTNVLTENLRSRPDSTTNKIASANNANDLIEYLKSKPTIESREILFPRIFNLCMLPRQFATVIMKLNHNELAQALQINNEALGSAHHQMLLLNECDFELLLKSLAEPDIIKLLSAKNALGQSFLNAATNSVDLKEVIVAHVLSSVTLKKWILSTEGMTHLFNITPQPHQIHHFFASNTTRLSSHQPLEMKLVNALSTEEIKLLPHEVEVVKMSQSLNTNLQLIANAKGITIERLYNAISSNDKPYALAELKGFNGFE